MFTPILQDVLNNSSGGLAALLLDSQGIVVASEVSPCVDLSSETLAAAFHEVLREFRQTTEILESGEPYEIVLQTSLYNYILRQLHDGYLVLLVQDPEGVLGQARFQLRCRLHRLQAILNDEENDAPASA